MILKNKSWGIILIFIQLFCVLTPSNAIFEMFGGGGGGGGGSDVAEILAAGLITTMLMEDFHNMGGGGGGGTQGRSVFNPVRQFIGGYSMRAPPPVHHYQPMIAPRRPMMHPAGPMVAPTAPIPRRPVMHPYMMAMMHRHQQYMMHQALMQQARQQMLATAWNNEYRMNNRPYASETVINSYVPVLPTFGEILSDEGTLSAAILLNSDLLDSDDEEEQEREEEEDEEGEEVEMVREEEPKEQEKQTKTPKSTSSEEFEVASSDHETHYILPRIMKHIVQRILRRVEHH
ncbi:uncharacterized protein LOC129966653 [Argiope bruennichi]|uniref:uncharacterized protein LOC129966653 n=1 Tax=Argiope bruennichi TaxID=94029 RepID=UPI002494AF8F|nr:uncharacterized protein LOC129966653 [Argiope bruennichi]